MANNVEPDQIAPSGAVWSGSALFACHFVGHFDVQNFSTFTILVFLFLCFSECIQVLGTDDATTCHIVILKHTGNYDTFSFQESLTEKFMYNIAESVE